MATGIDKETGVEFLDILQDIPATERNLCLVVEVPLDGYEDAYRRAPNADVGINVVRWQYVKEIHAVMPNIRQLYLFRSLSSKHYHCDKDKLVAAVREARVDLPALILHVHPPTENVLNHEFVKIINVGFDDSTRQLLSSIPLKAIAGQLHRKTVLKAPPSNPSSGTLRRQQYHKDVGFTMGKCLIGKDELGVSLPYPKPQTDYSHIKAMVVLSKLLKHHIFADLKDTVYFDLVHKKRREDFAGKFHPDNVLEALRSALSNAQHPCGCHDDSHNDVHPSFSPVITFSVFVKIDGVVYRLALIGYSRKAIREYYERRMQPDATLIKQMRSVIGDLPVS
jgi:hypothetical protein